MRERIKRSGIYQIVNEVNGKSYIGSSKDIDGRWADWRRNFQKPMKYKSLLRAAVQRYGIEHFTFILLEECAPTKEALEEAENKHIELIKPAYNICQQAYSPKGIIHPHTEETKAKIRAKRALQTNVRQKGYKMAVPAWNKGLPSPTKGQPRPPEVIAKISASKMGHTVSSETRLKISANNARVGYWLGKKRSEETKQKVSQALTGRTKSGAMQLRLFGTEPE